MLSSVKFPQYGLQSHSQTNIPGIGMEMRQETPNSTHLTLPFDENFPVLVTMSDPRVPLLLLALGSESLVSCNLQCVCVEYAGCDNSLTTDQLSYASDQI